MRSLLVSILFVGLFSSLAQALDLNCTLQDDLEGAKAVQVEINTTSGNQWMKVTSQEGDKISEGTSIKTTSNGGDIEYYTLNRWVAYRELNAWTLIGTGYTCEVQ